MGGGGQGAPGQQSADEAASLVPGQREASGVGAPKSALGQTAALKASQSSLADAAYDKASKGPVKKRRKLTEGTGTADRKSVEDYSQGSLFAPDDPLVDEGPQYGYDRIRLGKRNEVSPYAEVNDARYAMDPRKRNCILLAVALVVITVIIIILPDSVFNTTYVNMSIARWVELLSGNLSNLAAMVTFQDECGSMCFKTCQYLIVIIAGAGLAATGAMFQGALKNAMASPSTLGVMSGGQMGSVLYILLGGSTTVIAGTMTISQYNMQYAGLNLFQYIWAKNQQTFCSLAGACLTVLIVVGIAYLAGRGKVSKSGLIIAGSVLTTVCSSVMQLVRYWLAVMGDEDQSTAVQNISTGTLSQIFVPLDVALIGIPVVICLVILITQSSKMNLLAFTDEEAASMGLSPHASRILVIAVCTFMTAVIVAFCGGVGFVGFMVPHITRKFVGPDFKYLVPGSMLVGAGYCVITNCVSNMALTGLGMGSLTGIIGSIAFLVSVLMQRRRGNADWV